MGGVKKDGSSRAAIMRRAKREKRVEKKKEKDLRDPEWIPR